MKYSGFRRDVKRHVLTFSTPGQRQVTTCCTCAMTSRKKSHVSGCRRQAGDVCCLRCLFFKVRWGQGLKTRHLWQKYRGIRQSRFTCCTIKVTVKSISLTCGSLKVTKTKFLFFKNVLSASCSSVIFMRNTENYSANLRTLSTWSWRSCSRRPKTIRTSIPAWTNHNWSIHVNR